MKILFFKGTLAGPVSGADEILTRYAIEMKKAGHQTSILLVHAPETGIPQVDYLEASGIPISILASQAFSTWLTIGRKIALRLMNIVSPASQVIRAISRKIVFNLVQRYQDACCEFLLKSKPDVIHVVTPDPGAVMMIRAAYKVGIPVVYQEVGIPFHPPGFEEVYAQLAAVLPLCSGVAALSPLLAAEMEKVLPELEQVQVLPLISEDESKKENTQTSPSEDVCFGFAARLEQLKGPLTFVEAFANIHSLHPNVNIKIAGNGSQRKVIIGQIKKYELENKSRLIGVYKTTEERNRFMQSIDVFVLPSLTEGTPNAIIEAMSHGKPIIATDVGGIADMVTDEIGLLIPAGDAEALADAMKILAVNAELRRKMGSAAREKYNQLFTSLAVLPVITEFYQQAISSSKLNKRGEDEGNPSDLVNHPWIFQTRSPQKLSDNIHQM